jgi:hypothetical protein
MKMEENVRRRTNKTEATEWAASFKIGIEHVDLQKIDS